MFSLADQLIRDGNLGPAAKVLAALQHDPDLAIRTEASFRLARLRERQGDLPAAIALYRAILAEQPGLGSVRLALAAALARAGSQRQARGELRHALAEGLPDQVAQAVDRFATALRSDARLGGVIEIGIAPDSNISHATTRDAVTVGGVDFLLTPDARQRGGIGGYAQSQGYWRPELAPHLNLLTTLSGTANLFGASRFDDVAATLAVGPELVHGRSRVQVAAQLGERWFGNHLYSRSYGGSLSALLAIGARTQLNVAAQMAEVRYPTIDAQTGLQGGGSVSLDRKLSPHLSARITVQAEHDNARSPAFTTWTYGGSALLSRTFGRALLFVTASRIAIQGAGPFAFPPAKRQDRLWQAQAGVQTPPILDDKLKPVIRLRYAANRSPVFFYQYHELRAELGISHDF